MIHGIDVSSHQGAIDWAKVAADAQAIKFAVVRVTIGSSGQDGRAAQNLIGAEGVGLIAFPYWVFVETQDGAAQARAFLNRYRAIMERDPIGVKIDFERDDNVANQTSRERLQDAIYEIYMQTKRMPDIYTSESKWESLINIGGHPPTWTDQIELWVANYGVTRPAIPDGWLYWRYWQYSSSGRVSGIAGNVDMNWFNGTIHDLRYRAGLYPTMGRRVADLEGRMNIVERKLAVLEQKAHTH